MFISIDVCINRLLVAYVSQVVFFSLQYFTIVEFKIYWMYQAFTHKRGQHQHRLYFLMNYFIIFISIYISIWISNSYRRIRTNKFLGTAYTVNSH